MSNLYAVLYLIKKNLMNPVFFKNFIKSHKNFKYKNDRFNYIIKYLTKEALFDFCIYIHQSRTKNKLQFKLNQLNKSRFIQNNVISFSNLRLIKILYLNHEI
jgi:hypothetical protein